MYSSRDGHQHRSSCDLMCFQKASCTIQAVISLEKAKSPSPTTTTFLSAIYDLQKAAFTSQITIRGARSSESRHLFAARHGFCTSFHSGGCNDSEDLSREMAYSDKLTHCLRPPAPLLFKLGRLRPSRCTKQTKHVGSTQKDGK